MQFKTFFNALFLIFLCSGANAAPSKNDCNELKNDLSYAEIERCKVNRKGEMTELKFTSTYYLNSTVHQLNATDYDKIFSYPTIRKLEFYDEYSNCTGLTNRTINLKSLEELKIRSFRGTIAANILKNLKSLRTFIYDAGDYHLGELSQDNINELATLSNLRNIELDYVYIDEGKLNFSPLKKLKVSTLKLETNGKGGINLRGLVKNLRYLKELKISHFEITNQKELDTITSSNIEKLTIALKKKNKLKTENFKNLKNLTYLNLTMKGLKEVPEFVTTIPNLETLIFNNKEIDLVSLINEANAVNDAGNADTTTLPTTTVVANPTFINDDNALVEDEIVISSSTITTFVRAINFLPIAILALKVMF